MGFFVTTLIFLVIGIIASLSTRICCNRGPSANLFHLTLVITATVCCWMMERRCLARQCFPSPTVACTQGLFNLTDGWAIIYLAQMNPLIVPILNEE